MLHAGLDLSRKSLEVHLLAEDGATVAAMSVPPMCWGCGRWCAWWPASREGGMWWR